MLQMYLISNTHQKRFHTRTTFSTLFVLLGAQAGIGVGHLDGQLLGSLYDRFALLGRDGMGNLGTIFTVLHHEQLQILHLQIGNVYDDSSQGYNSGNMLFPRTNTLTL